MSALENACTLLLGAMSIAGCSERNDPTASRALPPASFATLAPLSSVVTDPVGDLENKGSDYQDIIRAEIAKQGTNLAFVLTLVASVPESPALPSGADVIVWQFLAAPRQRHLCARATTRMTYPLPGHADSSAPRCRWRVARKHSVTTYPKPAADS